MSFKKKAPAVFLDRDGTILNERGYLSDPRRIKFYRSAFRGLRALQKQGFKLVVVSNQSGVGRGLFSLEELKKVNRSFQKTLLRQGIQMAGIYFCPHLPDAGCRCRKPNPGMARQAARELHLDFNTSYVIGDQKRDLQLAQRIKAQGVLVLTGAGKYYRQGLKNSRVKVTKNLETASRWIFQRELGKAWKK